MQILVKHIRDYLGLSQTDLAEKIGVNFATVNRWENGRALPTKLAQAKLYDYCKEQGVPVYQFVLDKIENAANSVDLEDGRILLYHGSKSGIIGDIAPKSREMCDFGKGFYMGTEPGQPLTLCCQFSPRSTSWLIAPQEPVLSAVPVPLLAIYLFMSSSSIKATIKEPTPITATSMPRIICLYFFSSIKSTML